jgi:hypothetical protein
MVGLVALSAMGVVTIFGDNIRKMFGASVNALANTSTDSHYRAAPQLAAVSASRNTSGGASGRPASDSLPGGMNRSTAGIERKLIHNAELYLDVDSPEDAQRAISALAESYGGFVVSSNFESYGNPTMSGWTSVKLVLRVPSADFNGALDALHKVGKGVTREDVTGQDVTEEYVDIEARLRAQRAVEAQYLEILKNANKVQDALDVQQKLGEVRTEIERVEGRKRYLEDQSSLSTLTIYANHQPPVVIEEPGFVSTVKHAAHDAVATSVAIVFGGIRLLGVLVPITFLVLLPGWLLIRVLRRFSKAKNVAPAISPAAS